MSSVLDRYHTYWINTPVYVPLPCLMTGGYTALDGTFAHGSKASKQAVAGNASSKWLKQRSRYRRRRWPCDSHIKIKEGVVIIDYSHVL